MIAITGATGTNGGLLLDRLEDAGKLVRVLARNPAKIRRGGRVEALRFDYDDPSTHEQALAGVDRLFLVDVASEREAEREAAVLDAAERARVRHVVYLSVIGVDAPDPIRLAVAHRETEERLRAGSAMWTMLRPTGFMQNFFAQASSIAGGAFHAPTGKGATSFIDARDIADVAFAALTQAGHEGRSYELTGPRALSGEDVASVFSGVLKHDVRFVDADERAFTASLRASGASEWNIEAIAELYRAMRDGKSAHVARGVEEAIGRAPRDLADFVHDYRQRFV